MPDGMRLAVPLTPVQLRKRSGNDFAMARRLLPSRYLPRHHRQPSPTIAATFIPRNTANNLRNHISLPLLTEVTKTAIKKAKLIPKRKAAIGIAATTRRVSSDARVDQISGIRPIGSVAMNIVGIEFGERGGFAAHRISDTITRTH